jgi:hypothetical protein
MSPGACKRCGSTTRALQHPGPRCATCWREVKKARSKAAHSNRCVKVFGITGEEYDALYEAQGGRCYICRKATGKAKRLAVDHDHEHCDICAGPQTCGSISAVRGLLCGPCNKDVIGRLGEAALTRALNYLVFPPAQPVLAKLRGV